MADLISYEDKLKVIFYSTKWPEGVVDLIFYEDKLKAISHSTKCSEGVGGFDTLQKEVEGNISLNNIKHNGQKGWRI